MTTEPLTTREREVCDLICRGFSNKETARKLGISARTVEDHRLQAMKKYRAENVVQLVRKVYKLDEIATQ